jgi:tetratricopeptide (TPR) repeat protein
MSLQFLTLPPYTDIKKIKGDARKAAKSSGAKLAHSLEEQARSIAGCYWQTLLSDHSAILQDGNIYLTVDNLQVRVESLFGDDDGHPIAVGQQASIQWDVDCACTLPSGETPPTPGLRATYGPGASFATVVLDINNPTHLDGKIVTTDDYGSPRIPLRERVGPVVEAIRSWVAHTHQNPKPFVLSLPEEEIYRLTKMEAGRIELTEDREFFDRLIDLSYARCTPKQANRIGLWLSQVLPMHSGSYTIRARDTSLSVLERISLLKQASEVERRNVIYRLGENDIAWWGDMETRTFMQTSRSLADLQTEAGLVDDAIDTLQYLLALNPNDNQGNRYPFLGLLLLRRGSEDHQAAHSILTAYADQRDAILTYAATLLSYQRNGDCADGRELKAHGEAENQFFPIFASEPIPDKVPQSFGSGTMEEAVLCLSFLGHAFQETPGAVDWIESPNR